jgi:23S rRNA pseudouridine2457 synthase
LVLVLKKVTPETLEQLRNGVSFLIKGNEMYTTSPVKLTLLMNPIFCSHLHIKTIYQEYTWLKITITEGKYRQIRKMVWAVKHRCVRLVRTSIVNLQLGDLQPGEIRELAAKEFLGHWELISIELFKLTHLPLPTLTKLCKRRC